MEHRIIRLEQVDSTNNYIRQFSEDGLVVIADTQTAGRGRQGRSFQSAPKAGIYLSMLLKPKVSLDKLFHLTPIAAQAVCDGIETVTGQRPRIKWINDLLMDDRKICGILTELSLTGEGAVEQVILGIGINVNQCLEDFEASLRSIAGSIAMATGRTWDREALLAAVLQALDGRLEAWARDEVDLMGYRADCATLGRQVRVLRGGGERNAFAEDIDEDFALVVRYEDGSRERINSGEVSVRGLEGYH